MQHIGGETLKLTITMENICYTFMLTLLHICHLSDGLTYHVVEESDEPHFYIGNIAHDFNLTSRADSDIFSTLRFSFLNKEKNPHVPYFNLSEETGDLYTVGVLDREEICQFNSDCSMLLGIAVQSSIHSFFQKIKINITVVDINDHSPKFATSPIHISISESISVGQSVTIDGATDPDSLQNTIQSYSILTPGSPFSTKSSKNLDGSSSIHIIVDEALDRESVDSYQVEIIARDGGDPQRNGTVLVNITVSDSNDNKPVFSNSIYNVTVKEDIAINSTIVQVSALDRDFGENGQIQYGLATHQSQEIKDLFSIDTDTGKLMTTGRLIYLPDAPYTVIVEASDSGSQPQTTQAFVYVHVQDVKNNPPEIIINFLSSTNFSKVSEYANSGAVVALIDVSDSDVGWNGITNCSIQSDAFQLQRSEIDEYKVIVAKALDREEKNIHKVIIFCTDIGSPPLNSTKTFSVLVTDENDETPVFSSNVYHTEILENNLPSDIIVTVSASDQDTGANAKVHYALAGDAWGDFYIEADRGVIHTSAIFDRETKDSFSFHVLAIDGGTDPHTATATVELTILDTNDNKPKFTNKQRSYNFTVAENQPSNEYIGEVAANDTDDGDNGFVTYSVAENYEITIPFKLSPDGVLRTKIGLDRELQSRYDFKVIATDQGSPRLYTSIDVSVNVDDINDNSPFIVSPEEPGKMIHLTLATPINTPIYLVKAHDIDDGNNAELVYRIEDRNDTHIFDINDSGQVLVARPIEASEAGVYILKIVIYDNGEQPNSASTSLLMSIAVRNTTEVQGSDDGLHSQNLLIALTVVLVTVVLAATIVITIFIIRRMDKRKRDCLGADVNSVGSSEVEVVPGLVMNSPKDYYTHSNNNMQLGPVVSQVSLEQGSTKDFVYKPRLDTPTPSCNSNSRDDSEHQIAETVQHESSTPRLNRLASLRLQQVLLQSHDKPWTNQNDNGQGNQELYCPGRGAEDSHSQVSGDGDSGRGGSVSDGHITFSDGNMGLSHDADDLRIMQLQNIVRQSGRRGTPPHLHKDVQHSCINENTADTHFSRDKNPVHSHNSRDKNPVDSHYSHEKNPADSQYSRDKNSDIHYSRDSITNSHQNLAPSRKQVTNSPPIVIQSNIQTDQSNGSRNNLNSNSYRDSPDTPHRQNSCTRKPSQRTKTGPGIQMGLSSITTPYSPNPHLEMYKPPPHHRQSCDNYPRLTNYPCDHYPADNRILNDTLESITTTAYDDDDNTTTSGSYTIDSTMVEDFPEYNVPQLKDMFV